jgi:HEAT repeat protein
MNKQSIQTLLDDCGSDDPALQAEAVIELVDAQAYVAVPEIVKLLTSPDPSIRSSAAYALGYLGSQAVETVGPVLLNLLTDPEVIVRSDVVEALGGLHYIPAVEHIKYSLQNDNEPLVRASAAEALGEIGDNQALATLELSLKDSDESVRAYAANSIGLLGTSQLVPELETYLQSEHSLRVKAELLGAMYRLGATEQLNQLISLLNNADEHLATCILNLLTDLTERQVPATLADDAPKICKSLTGIVERFPILSSHVEEIAIQLKSSCRLGQDDASL